VARCGPSDRRKGTHGLRRVVRLRVDAIFFSPPPFRRSERSLRREMTSASALLAFASACIERVGAESPASIVASDPNLLLSIAELAVHHSSSIVAIVKNQIRRYDIEGAKMTIIPSSSSSSILDTSDVLYEAGAICGVGEDVYVFAKTSSASTWCISPTSFIPLPSWPASLCEPEEGYSYRHPRHWSATHYNGKIEFLIFGGSSQSVISSCMYDIERGTWQKPKRYDMTMHVERVVVSERLLISYIAGCGDPELDIVIREGGQASCNRVSLHLSEDRGAHILGVLIIGKEVWLVAMSRGYYTYLFYRYDVTSRETKFAYRASLPHFDVFHVVGVERFIVLLENWTMDDESAMYYLFDTTTETGQMIDVESEEMSRLSIDHCTCD